jgi:hypothetical protein
MLDSVEHYRSESLFELRHLAAGMNSVNDSVGRLRSSVDASGMTLATALSSLSDEQVRSRHLISAALAVQIGILDTLRAPVATKAAELAARGTSAARRGLWHEALNDFDLSLRENWDQPDTLFKRGMAADAIAAENSDPAAEPLVRTAAASSHDALRYGVATMPEVAAVASLMATAQYDRLGETAQADDVLRTAARQLDRSPEVQFAAALRFRDGRMLCRAVDLDPTLARDPSWVAAPWARDAVERLRTRHAAAITAANEWFAGVERFGVAVPPPAQPVGTPADGYRHIRGLISAATAAGEALHQPTAHEQQLLQQADGFDAQGWAATAAATQVLRRSNFKPIPAIIGLAVILATCVGWPLALYTLVGPEPTVTGPRTTENIIMVAGMAGLFIGVGFIVTPLLFGPNRHARATALTAGNESLHHHATNARNNATAIRNEREAQRERLDPVVATLTATTTRSPNAFSAPRSGR